MGIKIKLRKDKYRLLIEQEEFEFENRSQMEAILKLFLDLKESRGRTGLQRFQRKYKDFDYGKQLGL